MGTAAILVPAVASVAIATFIGWMLVLAGVLIGVHAWAILVGVRALTGAQALKRAAAA